MVGLLTEQGLHTRAFACDVTSSESVAALTRSVTAQLGAIDILVNNVGWAGDDPVHLSERRPDPNAGQRQPDVDHPRFP